MSLRWLIPTMAMVLALAHWHVAMGDNPTHSHDGVSKHSGRKHAAHNQVSPNVELSKAQETEPRSRPCTIDELLPVQTETELAPEWSTELVTDFPFNCTCPFYRARYYCPHEDGKGYPIWVPRSVAHGICNQVLFPALLEAPFPPTWKVLYYGNSHMRQVLESTMCTFHQTVLRKRVTLEQRDVVVPGFTQCRACSNEAMGLGKLLVDHDCMSEVDNNCKCSDDRGQFFFQNEAMVHYYFSNGGKKSFETALNQHEVMSLSFYDVIIANTGNGAPMETEYLLKSAQVMHDAGVQLIWLNLYDGRGNIADWEEDERARFADSGAKFLPIEYMVRGLDQYRKGDVEPQVNPSDPHYCLPGPPTEIGLLLLQLLWATYEERESLINRKA